MLSPSGHRIARGGGPLNKPILRPGEFHDPHGHCQTAPAARLTEDVADSTLAVLISGPGTRRGPFARGSGGATFPGVYPATHARTVRPSFGRLIESA